MTDHPGHHGVPSPEVPSYGQVTDPAPVYPPPYSYGPPAPQYGYGPPPGYQPYPPQPYPPQAYPLQLYPQASSTNGLAIASMVLGIVWIDWIGSVLALIFGFIARSQIRKRGQNGDGMAIAGIVLGFVGMATLIAFVIFVFSADRSNDFFFN